MKVTQQDLIDHTASFAPDFGKTYWHSYGAGYQRCVFVGYHRTKPLFCVRAMPANGATRSANKYVEALWDKHPTTGQRA